MVEPASERTTLRRGKDRAAYELDVIRAILDAGFLAHVGVSTGDGPIVLPMVYGRDDDNIYLHGGVANAMLRAGKGVDVCVTVTIVDALIVARSPLHNSMNYRSVVIRGQATLLDDEAERIAALRLINDHIVATWDQARPPSAIDLRQTQVIAVPLAEASAKVRTGQAIDDPEDLDGPHWAGVVPLHSHWGAPVSNDDLVPGIAIPAALEALEGRGAGGA